MEPDVNAAIRKGFFQQVRFLLQLDASPDCRDEHRRTPLMNCALIEDERWGVGLARTLLESGASMRCRDGRGMNALHHACIYGRRALVELLIGSPDFNIDQPDRHGNAPLHYAAVRGDEAIVEMLLEALARYGLSPDRRNGLGFTALMQAWRSGQEGCALALLRHGADVGARDLVHGKTAEDYAEEYRRRRAARKERDERRARGFFFDLTQQRRRPSSAASVPVRRSAGRQSGENGSGRTSTVRPASSTLLGRRRGATPTPTPTEADDTIAEEAEVDYLRKAEKERLAGRLIRSASLSDIRNKPEQLLNISPIECFVKERRFQILNEHSSSAAAFRIKESDDDVINNNAMNNEHNRNNNNIRGNCWKSEMKKMYSAFQYQFTPSYRKPAQPKEPEVTDVVEEVACSPIPSEMEAGDKDKNKKSKKAGNKALQEEKQDKKLRKMSGRSLSRKSSNVSLKSQQAAADCSSNESLNNSKKGGKKRPTEHSLEVPDIGADKATKTEKNGKARSRKISAALDDHVTPTDQSSNVSAPSRGLTIPVVKEPIGQDQLGPIRE